MRAGRVRLLILLDLAAVALLVGGLAFVVLTIGTRDLGRAALAAAAIAGLGLLVSASLLQGAVVRPLERMLAAAERLDGARAAADLPVLAPEGEGGLSLTRAAVAFERTSDALAAERARLAAKVEELEAARESLVRTEKLATVGRLAAGVAHEIGNPLGAIAGYAEIARGRVERGQAAEAVDFLDRIRADVRRIDAIVRDLLDFARPAEPALGPVGLGGAVEAAVRLARPQPRFRDVEVTVRVPPGLPPVVADARRLEGVVLNLLLNAADAMGGRGPLELAAAAEGGAVVLDVLDRGTGIAPENLPRVFDPFFTTKPPGAGTGLGLSICLRVVESFGGTLEAANREGGGARLRVRLPAAAGPV
ncbi:MAG: ATP-binding protein [Anaeromyxobacteraceae bacterium]